MARTHDYTRRGWGPDFIIHTVVDGGAKLKMSGWGHGVEKGDYLILSNKGGTTRYAVESVSYYRDPPDMWSIDAALAPRIEEVA